MACHQNLWWLWWNGPEVDCVLCQWGGFAPYWGPRGALIQYLIWKNSSTQSRKIFIFWILFFVFFYNNFIKTIISVNNRCFTKKVILLWSKQINDDQHRGDILSVSISAKYSMSEYFVDFFFTSSKYSHHEYFAAQQKNQIMNIWQSLISNSLLLAPCIVRTLLQHFFQCPQRKQS